VTSELRPLSAASDPARSPARPGVAAHALALAALALPLLGVMALAFDATVDDAWISLRHARNWLAHGVPSFQPVGPPVEAYSNFLWMALSAGLLRLGLDPMPVLKLLGAASALGCVAAAAGLARALGAGTGFAALAALLVSLSAGLAFWAVSGLETAPAALLLTAGVWLLLPARPARDRAAAGVLLLLALTRFEAPVWMAAVAAARLLHDAATGPPLGARLRREARWVLPLTAVYLLYTAWRGVTFGHLVPSPIHFKRVDGAAELAASHAAAFVRGGWPLLLAAAPCLALRRAWPALAPVVAALAVFATARREVLDDVSTMAFFDRYFVPILPCLAACAALGLQRAGAALRGRGPLRVVVPVAAGALVAAQLLHPEAGIARVLSRSLRLPEVVAARNVPAAGYLRERHGEGGVIAAGDVGRTGWEFPGRLLDVFGLADYTFALHHGGDLAAYHGALLAERPDAVLICHQDPGARPCHAAEAALLARPGFRAHYVLTRTFGREIAPRGYLIVYERRASGRTGSDGGAASGS